MNVVDVIILLSLGLGVIIGFKRGFFKQTVIFVGTILIFVLAFMFKSTLAEFFYEYFPFFNFKGLSSLNIFLYEAISFMVLLIIFGIILKILIKITGLFETLLKLTIILAIPSKILGAIVGFFQSYVIIYIILLILNFPIFNIGIVNESKYKDKILESTPILSNISQKLVKSGNEIYKTLKDSDDVEKINKEIFEIIKNNDIISIDKLDKLIEKNKLKVSD